MLWAQVNSQTEFFALVDKKLKLENLGPELVTIILNGFCLDLMTNAYLLFQNDAFLR